MSSGPGDPPGEEPPRVVPVYAVTRGRTRSLGRDLPWEALVRTTPAGRVAEPRLRFEPARIVALCRRPKAVTEVAAALGVPLGVARVLVSDLNAEGLLSVHLPTLNDAGRPGADILERLLAGLRSAP